METLATLLPKPKIGEWYLVKTQPESKNKILVHMSMYETPTQDTFHSGPASSYFDPEKVTYDEAKAFLKNAIMEKEALESKDSTQKAILECMHRFYRFYFER